METIFRRNPNGLQPLTMFPEDYPKRYSVQFAKPPLKLQLETHENANITEKYWHGYTGAKTFFTHQPLPSTMHFTVYGGYAPQRSVVNAYVPTIRDAVQCTTSGVPQNITTAVSLFRSSAGGKPQRPEIHPTQVDVPDSRLWRYDGRNHSFGV